VKPSIELSPKRFATVKAIYSRQPTKDGNQSRNAELCARTKGRFFAASPGRASPPSVKQKQAPARNVMKLTNSVWSSSSSRYFPGPGPAIFVGALVLALRRAVVAYGLQILEAFATERSVRGGRAAFCCHPL